jgi:hypothetical protein
MNITVVIITSDISGSHGGKYTDVCLLCVGPCSLVETAPVIRVTEAMNSSETSVKFYETMGNIPEDGHLHHIYLFWDYLIWLSVPQTTGVDWWLKFLRRNYFWLGVEMISKIARTEIFLTNIRAEFCVDGQQLRLIGVWKRFAFQSKQTTCGTFTSVNVTSRYLKVRAST